MHAVADGTVEMASTRADGSRSLVPTHPPERRHTRTLRPAFVAARRGAATGARRAGLLPDLRDALEATRGRGWALVRDALDDVDRGRLLAEAEEGRFLALPESVGRIRHVVDELVRPVVPGDGTPVGDLAAALQAAVTAAAPRDAALEQLAFNQALYLRYRGRSAGIGPHLDGKCYVLLVAAFTLRGSATFSVRPAGRTGARQTVLVGPGDLCLLRAPGFGGPDGRPQHAVGPPAGDGERISLTLRMRGRPGPGAVLSAPPAR